MDKSEFLNALCARLGGMPRGDVEERLDFYGEMIDDRMEEGLSEEDAVAALGTVEEIARQIVADIPLTKIVKERIKGRRRLRGWEIALLAALSPVWFPLVVSAFAVVISLYATLWSLIISLWAVFAALAGSALGGVLGGAGFVALGNTPSGLALIAAGMVCAGLGILSIFGCKTATVGGVVLTKKMALGIKSCFRKKEEV